MVCLREPFGEISASHAPLGDPFPVSDHDRAVPAKSPKSSLPAAAQDSQHSDAKAEMFSFIQGPKAAAS